MKPELIYHNYCSVCHGDRGDGRSRASGSLVPPPRDFTSAVNLSRETMIAAVTNGKAGTAMTSWITQLSEAEIQAVVDYIRNGFMQAATDPKVARGYTVYGHFCVSCHGESGKGPLIADPHTTNPTPDLSIPSAGTASSRDQLIISISHGKPGTTMEAFDSRLSAQDIEAVADYIDKVIRTGPIEAISGTRARGGQPQAMAPATSDAGTGKAGVPEANSPFPNGLSGNRKRGEKYYKTNCSACHGMNGGGDGPRAYFINPKPRNFTAASSAGFNRPMLYAAISMGKVGTVMPAWSTVLKDQEIADIAEFVYSSFIRPGSSERANSK